jgi:beta-galactosidase/beta-glucuronidase
MSSPLNPDDEAAWLRKLGSAANNRGWTLTEQLTRTPEEDQEMLNAAHASVHLWRTIGNDKNFALGHLLLGQVHALLGNASYAINYANLAYAYFTSKQSDPWEVAMVHAVRANAAHCAGLAALHESHYQTAEKLVAALSDLQEKEILLATLRVVPKPGAQV